MKYRPSSTSQCGSRPTQKAVVFGLRVTAKLSVGPACRAGPLASGCKRQVPSGRRDLLARPRRIGKSSSALSLAMSGLICLVVANVLINLGGMFSVVVPGRIEVFGRE